MASFKFRIPFIHPDKNTVRNNWKTVAAISLAAAAAIGVGVTCAFFPPAIPFIAGITFFGAAPFAGLASMSVVAASFASAGIAAAAVFAGSAIINAVNKVSNLFDNLFRTKKTHITDFPNEKITSISSPYTNVSLKPENSANLDSPEVTLHDKRHTRDTLPTIPKPVTTARVENLGTTNNRYTTYQPIDAKVVTETDVAQHSNLVVGGTKP